MQDRNLWNLASYRVPPTSARRFGLPQSPGEYVHTRLSLIIVYQMHVAVIVAQPPCIGVMVLCLPNGHGSFKCSAIILIHLPRSVEHMCRDF